MGRSASARTPCITQLWREQMKLTRAENARKLGLIADLQEAKNELGEAVMALNIMLDAARGRVEDALAHYNQMLREADAWRDEIVQDWQAEWDDKSERWQESDAGQEARSQIDDLENMDLDELELDLPQEVDLSVDH